MNGSSKSFENDNNSSNTTPPNPLRIQKTNLPVTMPLSATEATPTRYPGLSASRSRSSHSIAESFTSSPLLTPSGSTLHLPSTSLTPLPSPLVLSAQGKFGSNVSLDKFALTSPPRRKGYPGLGFGVVGDSRRNATEFVPVNGGEFGGERSVSIGRTPTDDGLRREHTREDSGSLDEEVFVLAFHERD